MGQNLVKVTIPLSEDNLAGAATESLWAEPVQDGIYRLRNVPFYAKGVSYDDLIEAEPRNGVLLFKGVRQHNGHSTYRIFAKNGRDAPNVLILIERLKKMRCSIEAATDKLVGVDVLPQADIYQVYEALEESERNGDVDFQEGHCGHALRPK